MSKWISVKDRLPEEGELVLCCQSYGVMVVAWYSSLAEVWYEAGYNRTLFDVKYWQPLPELPKED